MTDSTTASEAPLPPDMTVAMAIQRLVAARRQNRLDAESARISGHLDHITIPYSGQPMVRKVFNQARETSDYFVALYGGPVPQASNIEELDSIAKVLIPRISYPLWIKNYFFKLRDDKSVKLEEWTAGTLLAAARDQLIRDMALSAYNVDHLYHPEALKVMNRIREMPGPVVILNSHFGPRIVRAYFTKELMDHVLIMRTKGESQSYTWNNANEAAFAAMKTLSAGGKISISPDGPMSARRVEVPVCGFWFDIAAGTAALAWDSKSHVVWLHYDITKDGFLPVLVDEGLRRESGETSKAFSTRFNAFYAKMLEQRLTGAADQFLVLPVVRKRLRPITT